MPKSTALLGDSFAAGQRKRLAGSLRRVLCDYVERCVDLSDRTVRGMANAAAVDDCLSLAEYMDGQRDSIPAILQRQG